MLKFSHNAQQQDVIKETISPAGDILFSIKYNKAIYVDGTGNQTLCLV
jgi:hypothetical protein